MTLPGEQAQYLPAPEEENAFVSGAIEVVDVFQDPTDGAIKIISRPYDSARATIETGRYVQKSDGPGGSEDVVCISSQIGCAMRCSFCASTEPFEYEEGKPPRRLFGGLTSAQMVSQAVRAFEISPPVQPDGIVFSFMGMGEPTQNMDEVISAIHALSVKYPESRATISTMLPKGVGISQVLRLATMVQAAEFPGRVKLHISLHASNDEARSAIMPNAEPISVAIDVGKQYAAMTGSRVKLNYVLVRGQNDSATDADELAELLKDTGLILKVSDLNPLTSPQHVADEDAGLFAERVREQGVDVIRFRSDGPNIASGCGQLVKGDPRKVGLTIAPMALRQFLPTKEYR